MRAAIARRGQLVVEDVPEPVPGPGEVLVAVRSCGICGSDLHTLRHAHSMLALASMTGAENPFDPDADFVMGHEYSGEVIDVGAGTDDSPVRVGDTIVSLPMAFTPTGLELIGFSNRYPGAFAEQMALTAGMCLPVPNGLDPRIAALTEPVAVAVHAVNKSAMQPGEGALVLGAGPIGLALIAVLKGRGVAPIVASDFSPRRRELAIAMGATSVVDPAVEPAIDGWIRAADAGAVPVVFEAIGVPGIIDDLCRAVPSGTRITVVGVCMETDSFLPLVAVAKELQFQFVIYYDPAEFGDTLRALAEGEIDPSPLLTGVVGIEGAPGAFAVLGHPDAHAKIVVEPGAGPSVVAI
ncbi:MAG: zinc-binding dehydrogenase [Acidimicrobiia bacterium]